MLIFAFLEAPTMQYSPWPLLFTSGFHHKCLVHKFHTLKSLRKLYAWYGKSVPFGPLFPLYGSIWKDVFCCLVLLLLHHLTSGTIPLKPLFHNKSVSIMLYISYFPGDFMGNFSLVWIFFHSVHDTNFQFISDTQTFCDYFNFKSLYKILCELYFALELAN